MFDSESVFPENIITYYYLLSMLQEYLLGNREKIQVEYGFRSGQDTVAFFEQASLFCTFWFPKVGIVHPGDF